MTLRRRILVRLAVPALLLALAAVAVLGWRARAINLQQADVRDRIAEASSAYDAGDWTAVRRLLSDHALLRSRPEAALELAEAVLRQAGRSPRENAIAAEQLLDELAPAFESGAASEDHRRRLRHLRMATSTLLGDHERALAHATAALAADKDDLPALRHRRDALEALDRFAEASQAAERAVAAQPQPAELADQSTLVRLVPDPLFRATRLVERARLEGRGLARALLVLAEANKREGRTGQADACLDQAAAVLAAGLPRAVLAASPDEWNDVPAARQDEGDATAPWSSGGWGDLAAAPRPTVDSPEDQAADALAWAAVLDGDDRHAEATDLLRLLAGAPAAHPDFRAAVAIRLQTSGDVAAAREVAALGNDLSPSLEACREWLGVRDVARLARVSLGDDDALTGQPRVSGAWQGLTELAGGSITPPVDRYRLAAESIGRLTPMAGTPARSTMREACDALLAAPLHLAAAKAAVRMGERDLAVDHLELAADRAPYWSEPMAELASMQLDDEDLPDAARSLDELTRRRPTEDRRLATLEARLAFERWQADPSVDRYNAARSMTFAALDAAGAVPELVTAELTLLAEQEPARAADEARRYALEADAATALAAATAASDLKLAEPPAPPSDVTAEDDLLQAGLLVARANGVAAAERWLEARQPDPSLSVARLLERLEPARAPAAWRRVTTTRTADSTDVAVWLTLLDEGESLKESLAGIATMDAAVARLIRTTAPAGDAPRQWRLHQARARLARTAFAQQPAADRLALEAADTLRELAHGPFPAGRTASRARVLLADALVQLRSPAAARPHLERQLAYHPGDGEATLRLLRVLDRVGDREAVQQLNGQIAIDGLADASGPVRVETARRLADAGLVQAALGLLERPGARVGPLGRLVEASLLERSGDVDAAGLIYDDLAATADAPSAVLLEAAVFHARAGRADRAASLMSRLDASLADAADRAAVAGVFEARTGHAEAARQHFDRVASLRPQYAAPWREAVSFDLARGDAKAAAKMASNATVTLREVDARLAFLIAAASAANGAESDAEAVRRLAGQLARRPDALPASVTPETLARAAQEETTSREMLGVLEATAEAAGPFVAAHRLLIATYVRLGDEEEAARVAARAAVDVPASPELQRLAYATTRDAGDASAAFHFAGRWRSLLQDDDPTAIWADTAVADGLILRGRHAEAAAVLRPRLEQAQSDPAAFGHLLGLATEAFAATGEGDAARELAGPRIGEADESGRSWRQLFARLAADVVPDADEARLWLGLLDYHIDRLPINAGGVEGGRLADEVDAAVAWGRFGVRANDPAALRLSRRRLLQLVEGPLSATKTLFELDLSRRTWSALARVEAASGDDAEAEAAWRRLLVIAPRDAAAANELAHLLLTKRGVSMPGPVGEGSTTASAPSTTLEPPRLLAAEAAEALSFAQLATSVEPEVAAHHDTHARALRANGAPLSQVRRAYGRALRLDAAYLDALLGLAVLELDASEAKRPTPSPRAAEDDLADPWTPTTQDAVLPRAESVDSASARSRAAELFERAKSVYRDVDASQIDPHLHAEYRRLAAAFGGE